MGGPGGAPRRAPKNFLAYYPRGSTEVFLHNPNPEADHSTVVQEPFTFLLRWVHKRRPFYWMLYQLAEPGPRPKWALQGGRTLHPAVFCVPIRTKMDDNVVVITPLEVDEE